MSENIFLGKWRIVESIPCSDENYSKTCSPREATPPLYNHEDTPLLRRKGASAIKSTNPEVFALLGIEFTLNVTGDVTWDLKDKSRRTPAPKSKEFSPKVEDISSKVAELGLSSDEGTSSDEKLSCTLENKDDLPSELEESSPESKEMEENDSSFKTEESSVNPENVFIKPLVDKPKRTFIPLLHCTAYQVVWETVKSVKKFIIRFSESQGATIEFNVLLNSSTISRSISLSFDGWGVLHCILIWSPDQIEPDFPLSFSSLLEQDMFLNPEEDNSLNPEQDKSLKPTTNPGSALRTRLNHISFFSLFVPNELRSELLRLEDEDTLHIVLHYLHTQGLKSCLTKEQLDKVVSFLDSLPTLEEQQSLMSLINICREYTLCSSIQQELENIVYELHDAVDQVLLQLGGRTVDERGKVRNPRNKQTGRLAVQNIPRLPALVKQVLGKGFLCFLKIVEFCSRFQQIKHQLGNTERTKIILFAKSRIPKFLQQLLELLKAMKYATSELNTRLRQDLVAYFVVEIEELIFFFTDLGLTVTDILEIMIEKRMKSIEGLSVNSLQFILVIDQVQEIRLLKEKLGYLAAYLIQEREEFVEESQQEKVRGLSKQLEQIVNEIPLLILHLDKFIQLILDDPRFEDECFLFMFTGLSGHVAAVLNNIVQFQSLIEPVLRNILDTLQQDSLEAVLVSLGLIINPASVQVVRVGSDCAELNPGLNLTERFSSSPLSRESSLAASGLNLFNTKTGADMKFELRHDTPSPLSYTDTLNLDEANHTETVQSIPAHRVVVCARCPWFLRALTSGMREERERKIVLRDCDFDTFNLFLKFIYSGLLDLNLSDLSAQTLADLLLLADRYELNDLLDCCDSSLSNKLEDDNVFSLLVLGDQFNSHRLRLACFDFISSRPNLLNQENIVDLPVHLYTEIQDLIRWFRPESKETEEVKSDNPHNARDPFTNFKYIDGDPFLNDPLREDWSHLQRNSNDPFLMKYP